MITAQQEIILPEGYTSRPAAMADAAGATDLFNACSLDISGVEEYKADITEQEWHTPGFNPDTDVRVVTDPQGRIVGYYEVWDSGAPHVNIFVWGRTRPGHTGQGIGTHLLGWAESRARQALDLAPEGARVVMRSFVLSHDKLAEALLCANGVVPIRYNLRMIIDIDDAPTEPDWPEGVRVRTFKGEEELREVVMAVRESFQDHWGFVARPIETDIERNRQYIRENPHFEPSLWFLAVDEQDRIVGTSLCASSLTEDPSMGWISTLGVVREYRRRGLGMALLQHSFAEFKRRGRRSVGLGVDASSLTGATRLYEKAGMHPAEGRTYAIYEKELRPGEDLTRTTVESGEGEWRMGSRE